MSVNPPIGGYCENRLAPLTALLYEMYSIDTRRAVRGLKLRKSPRLALERRFPADIWHGGGERRHSMGTHRQPAPKHLARNMW